MTLTGGNGVQAGRQTCPTAILCTTGLTFGGPASHRAAAVEGWRRTGPDIFAARL